MPVVFANQNETLDALCNRILGRTAGITEDVLRLNPGLADLGVLLPEGTRVQIPDNLPVLPRLQTVQLWT